MNCVSQVSSYAAAIFRATGRAVGTSSLCGPSSWKRRLDLYAGIKPISIESALTTFRIQPYSSARSSGGSKTTPSRSRRRKADSEPVMEPEKEGFYVVRKGDVVGVYRSFSDCQAQLGSSICDPPVSVYKGDSMPKSTQEYLASRGLRNALYTVRAADLKDDLFGKLVLCPLQGPTEGGTSVMDESKKRPRQVSGTENVERNGSTSISDDPSRKLAKIDESALAELPPLDSGACTLHFDGASKGNPGIAGAGAVLRAEDGRLICKIREGLGVVTNNVAEYRAVILGLKCALKKGFTRITIQGDSKLVCMQIQGLWKVKNQNLSDLYEEVKKLKDKFLSFKISHVLRERNTEADVQANLAITLADGQVQEEECGK
ncbi:uncharacterized protein LOC103928494 isoform X2 [Pyrus x bretschneideri]|uniref:uncharacterized protein LOC103928494 isoform X2 n=1 Tax=Pyrus x bretschneideri TaxID=225117 RepID=UPI00202F8BA7|nr:uncharacterized protein LOC103928494 isoform X2 [Pyrus x bretschneideri]